MFETTRRDGVLQARAERARWLATGWDGGYQDADAAYNVSVPEGWDRTDLGAYATERREAARFAEPGPTLFTGVDLRHARGARLDGVEAIATVGISNPAALPLEPDGCEPTGLATERTAGTVNLLVGTDRALADGALATLASMAVEAKTATLQQRTGFTGTTSDAVAVATDRSGQRADFAGSATPVGDATRATVRRAILDGLRARYAESEPPESVTAADDGIVTSRRAEAFDP
jgi:adenosylcobinamide hydrolase